MLVSKTLTSFGLTSLALVIGLAANPALALSLVDGAQPAEFPPASYTGDVYVDSRGCIYIRAGVSGAVTWVPRVSRDRNVVCGARPTFAGAAEPAETVAEAPAAPAPPPAPAPVAPAPAPAVPAPAPVAPASAPAPASSAASTEITRTVSLTCPRGGSERRVRADGIWVPLNCDAGQQGVISYIVAHRNGERTRVVVNPAAPEPAPVPAPAPQAPVVAAAAPAPMPAPAPAAPAPVTSTVHITCPDREGISRMYTSDGRVIPVRCGPQTVAPVTYIIAHSDGERTRVVASPPAAVPAAVLAPAPAATRPATATARLAAAPIVTPEGYRPAWSDGRLNPDRGPRSAAGTAQMDLLWTQTVPRILIDVTTGRDVTARFRNIRYPTLPSQAQIAAVAAGKTVIMAKAVAPRAGSALATTATRDAAATASHRYVQVGTFGVPANAQKTIARLQRLGLPVGVSRISRGGKAYQVVLAGPFSAQAKLNAALAQVRAAGFSDAILRR